MFDHLSMGVRDLAQGTAVVRVVGPPPDISADDYGAVLLDPESHKLKIVADTMH